MRTEDAEPQILVQERPRDPEGFAIALELVVAAHRYPALIAISDAIVR